MDANYNREGCTCSNNTYIRITRETPLLRTINGTEDERHVMEGKTYKAACEKEGWYLISFGSRKGWIPAECGKKLDGEPADRIMVAWDYIAEKSSNASHYEKYINKSCIRRGLDVISPTWFTREGTPDNPDSIRIVDKADREYVRIAHNHGYEVWGLIADFNYDRNYAVYTNPGIVDREIKEIVDCALFYDLDGINIDFEGFGSRCRQVYSEYVRKLSSELKKHNMVVSIDMTKESDSDAWGKCYDRAEISKYVDYVAYMAYDENGRLDVLPGSVGSLPWVEAGILELLNMGIPKEKILLGVPFYTRDWKVNRVQVEEKSIIVAEWEGIALYEDPDENSARYPLEKGSVLKFIERTGEWYKVGIGGQERFIKKDISLVLDSGETLYTVLSTASLPMRRINDINFEPAVEYDIHAGQKKITYTDDEGFLHFIWAEDEMSMEERLKLVRKYNLPGAAAWMLTQEKELIWQVIKRVLKQEA